MRLALILASAMAALLSAMPLAAATGCAGVAGLATCTSDLVHGLTDPLPATAPFHAWFAEAQTCWSFGCSAGGWSTVVEHARFALFVRAGHAQDAALRLLASVLV